MKIEKYSEANYKDASFNAQEQNKNVSISDRKVIKSENGNQKSLIKACQENEAVLANSYSVGEAVYNDDS